MRHLIRNVFPTAWESLKRPFRLHDIRRELDRRMSEISRDLERFNLSHQQIIDELHDAVERITGEPQGEQLA